MKYYEDITAMHGDEAAAVDVIIGGSPCQDLSVAGQRAGLDGERSSLFLDQIRVIKEAHSKYGRNKPRYMVWENVPGALSSANGEDFRRVLEETAKVADETAVIPRPEKGKWTTAGCIMGDGYSIAWRILDAQFWGVPQRRRRIALVADFAGQSAPEILFKPESVSGYTAESGEARQGIAGSAESGTHEAGDRVKCLTSWDCQSKRVYSQDGCMATLQAMDSGGADNSAVYIIPKCQYESNGYCCLDKKLFKSYCVYCIQGNVVDRDANCNGRGWRDDDVAYTLNTIDRPAVFEFAMSLGDGNVCALKPSDKARTLNCIDGHQIVITQQAIGVYKETGVASCCSASDYKGPTDIVCAVFREGSFGDFVEDGFGTVKSSGGCLGGGSETLAVLYSIVRRLTPLEHERLQGYPDKWSDIGEWADSKGKKHQTTDSARYKALGNSIALPPWRFVCRRICEQYDTPATMGSLFDGIGGFPLIWREINGADSVLWACEIDEYCRAVTQRRLP